jgi:hypothetical protein
MTGPESQMYDLGRQARRAGFETYACNVNNPVRKGYWLAGWHDEDIEQGTEKYFQASRTRVLDSQV